MAPFLMRRRCSETAWRQEAQMLLSVDVGGVRLDSPLIIASGTWPQDPSWWALDKVGAYCTKGITREPRSGNEGPRLCETPAGLLNSIGLENEGVEKWLRSTLPQLAMTGRKLIANVACESLDGLESILKLFRGHVDEISVVELNVSCPNVDCGGQMWGIDPQGVEEATSTARRLWDGPLWVKLTPQAPDITLTAKAAEKSGADAVVVANSWLGMAIDVENLMPVFRRVVAGLSGPAIFPLALRLVWQVAEVVSIPIIGCGGVSTWKDVLAMILAGASAVELGTVLFRDLDAPSRLCEDLENFLTKRKITRLSDLVGAARRKEAVG